MLEVFRLPFMQYALIATSFIAALCAFLGVYVVLKRIVFVTAALAQISTAGVAVAFLFGLNPTITSLAITACAVALLAFASFGEKIPQDSILGISYVSAFALGVLFISKSAQGLEELQHLLQGNILTITAGQITWLAITFSVIALIHLLYYKEFMFVSFDAEMAQTQGYRVRFWNLLLYLTIGVVISLGIKVSGVLLIFGFLVIPAAIALMLVRNMKLIFAIAIVLSLVSVVCGLYFSFELDLPSGPTIVAVLFALLLIAIGLRAARR